LDTEGKFNLVASYAALVIECGAVFVVVFGALQAITSLLKVIARGQAGEIEGRQIWLRFATWILLALEFALAADILNYFLAKDISAFDQSGTSGPTAQPS
jgi:uncharacterized membrane protein